MRRPRAGRGPDGGDSKFQIDVVVVRIVVVRIDCNPAPVPGPVVTRRSPLEALYSSRVDLERLKLSAGLGAYPPYCPHRFWYSGVPTSRIAHHVVGERFGASRNVVLPRFFLAHRLGRPLERSEIAWGCLWVRLGCARGQNKIAFNRDSRVFAVLPFSALMRISPAFRCALRPSPDPRARTPPDLSRPLRGPYESSRPNPRVQANDGANPMVASGPVLWQAVFPKLTKLRGCT